MSKLVEIYKRLHESSQFEFVTDGTGEPVKTPMDDRATVRVKVEDLAEVLQSESFGTPEWAPLRARLDHAKRSGKPTLLIQKPWIDAILAALRLIEWLLLALEQRADQETDADRDVPNRKRRSKRFNGSDESIE